MNRFTWYDEGVHFKCTGCGRCCTGGPGAVWVSDEELAKIASYLQIPDEVCEKVYTRKLDGRRALKERGPDYDCIFLQEKKLCTIYPVRPVQCQTFPFWPGVMRSREQWMQTAEQCEGINENAPLVDATFIRSQMERHDI